MYVLSLYCCYYYYFYCYYFLLLILIIIISGTSSTSNSSSNSMWSTSVLAIFLIFANPKIKKNLFTGLLTKKMQSCHTALVFTHKHMAKNPQRDTQ